MMKDAFKAIGIASFLAVSGMGFGLSGVFWIMNVSGVKQFSKQLKTLLGGDERQKLLEQMAVSEEVAATEKTLNDLLK